jgi:hypothetical protein
VVINTWAAQYPNFLRYVSYHNKYISSTVSKFLTICFLPVTLLVLEQERSQPQMYPILGLCSNHIIELYYLVLTLLNHLICLKRLTDSSWVVDTVPHFLPAFYTYTSFSFNLKFTTTNNTVTYTYAIIHYFLNSVAKLRTFHNQRISLLISKFLSNIKKGKVVSVLN